MNKENVGLENKQENTGHWKRFIIFTCIVGLSVGIFSVISDYLPDINEEASVFELVISYLAVMINSLPMWFIIAMLVGYIFARNIKEAVLLGAIYTIIAITFYILIGYFYEPVPLTFMEWLGLFVIYYGASTIGGVLGGGIGFLFKRSPYVLLILLAGLILQLFKNGTRSWGNIVGIGENVTYSLLIISIIIYLITLRRNKRITAFDIQR